jgi:hypothetical protein
MHHNIHRRAQLGVYLRLDDIPVPSMYGSIVGPRADAKKGNFPVFPINFLILQKAWFQKRGNFPVLGSEDAC